MKVLISQRAEEDLAHIYAHIAARNADAAERFKTETEKALALSRSIPNWGRAPDGKPATPNFVSRS